MDHIIGYATENNTSKGLCLTYRDAVGWDEQQFRMYADNLALVADQKGPTEDVNS